MTTAQYMYKTGIRSYKAKTHPEKKLIWCGAWNKSVKANYLCRNV